MGQQSSTVSRIGGGTDRPNPSNPPSHNNSHPSRSRSHSASFAGEVSAPTSTSPNLHRHSGTATTIETGGGGGGTIPKKQLKKSADSSASVNGGGKGSRMGHYSSKSGKSASTDDIPTTTKSNSITSANKYAPSSTATNSSSSTATTTATDLFPSCTHLLPLPSDVTLSTSAQRVVEHWNLSRKEFLHFYKKFYSLDVDRSHTIDPLEFFLFLNEPRTRMMNYVIPLIVQHGDDKNLSFSEWLVAIFGFCFLTPKEMLEHIFSFYDSSHIGRMNPTDLFKFCKHFHADNPLFPKDVVITIEKDMEKKGGFYDFDAFLFMTSQYPMVCFPVYHLQESMRSEIFGLKLFHRLDRRTFDIYETRTIGDRPPLYWWRKTKLDIKIWCCSWWCFPCCGVNEIEKEEEQTRRKKIKEEKKKATHRRETKLMMGGVIMDLGLGEEELQQLDVTQRKAMVRYLKKEKEKSKRWSIWKNKEEPTFTISQRRNLATGELDEKQSADENPETAKQGMARILLLYAGAEADAILDVWDSDQDSDVDAFVDVGHDEYAEHDAPAEHADLVEH